MNQQEHNEIISFVQSILSRQWDISLISQFQLNIHIITKPTNNLINVCNQMIDERNNKDVIFTVSLVQDNMVVSVRHTHVKHLYKPSTNYDDTKHLCGKLFEAMVHEINDIKKTTSLEINCIYDLDVCYYAFNDVDCFSPVEFDEPVRCINSLFSGIANEYLSLRSVYDKSKLQNLMNFKTFADAIHILPQGSRYVVLFGY